MLSVSGSLLAMCQSLNQSLKPKQRGTFSHVPGSCGQESAGHCDCQPHQVHVQWSGLTAKGKQGAVIRRTLKNHVAP